MPVHKLAAQGSLTTSKIDYPSMLAGYGDFGAMTRIASTVLSSNASNLTAFNISGTFQDLFMVCSLRAVNAAATSNVYFAIGNGTPDGGSNYSLTLLRGDGGGASTARFTNLTGGQIGMIPAANATAGIFGSVIVHILNYTTSANKTVLSRAAADRNGAGNVDAWVNMWRNSGPVTVIQLGADGQFAAGSSLSLYGLKASAA